MRCHLAVVLGLVTLLACSSSPRPAPPATPAPPASPAKLAPAQSEAIAGVGLGDPAATVVAALGPPDQKGEVVQWEATGERTSTWKWTGHGMQIEMNEATAERPEIVSSITVEAPSRFTTSRGVGIGTPFAEVDKIYREFRGVGRDEGEPEAWGPDQIIVGSVYGGTFFGFADGKVVRMFVGAGAE